MEVNRIYFDLDDVLADFTGGVRDICGLEIRGDHPVSDDVLFEGIRVAGDFYKRVNPIADSVELFSDLRVMYGDAVEILTAIPKPSRGLQRIGDDKIEWIGRHIGRDVKVNIVYRREKVNFVRNRGSILIDDNPGNIEAWEAAGGTGLLFTDASSARTALDSLGILLMNRTDDTIDRR